MDLKEKVLIALADVSSPDGTPLTQTGKLSAIVASDGKVFFSITTDAESVKLWENVRGRAEAGVAKAGEVDAQHVRFGLVEIDCL